MFYAAINTKADLAANKLGDLSGWEIARFRTKGERDVFVLEHLNMMAIHVTRWDAEIIWKDKFLHAGKQIPKCGLFAKDCASSNFYGE